MFLEYEDGSKIAGTPVAASDAEFIELLREIGRRYSLSEREFNPLHVEVQKLALAALGGDARTAQPQHVSVFDPAQVLRDVESGVVTTSVGRDVYGVALRTIDDRLGVDAPATDALRTAVLHQLANVAGCRADRALSTGLSAKY